jgi:hypothetical protein
MSSLLERRALAVGRKTGIAIMPSSPTAAGAERKQIELNLSEKAYADRIVTQYDLSVEHEPRATVLKMLTAAKLDENYTFKVASGEADNYIQAMRQVLSRTRKKAASKKQKLTEFKMLRVSVETTPTHDTVTLVRTRTLDAHHQSVYSELMEMMQNKGEE